MKLNTELLVPFDSDGNMLESIYRWMNKDEDPWKYTLEKNKVFEDVLKIKGYHNTTATVRIRLEDSKGKKYTMVYSHFYEAMMKLNVVNGLISGKWSFLKIGSMFTLVPVFE